MVAVHEAEPIDLVGVADEPVGPVGFEQMVVALAHKGEVAGLGEATF